MSNDIVLELPPVAGNVRNSEGAFVTLKSGRIFFAYTKYEGDGDDAGRADIASRYSDDGGRTWSASDRVIVRREGDLNTMSVSLLRLQDGRIAMITLRKDFARGTTKAERAHAHRYELIDCTPWIRFSDDECKTFGKPTRITTVPGYYVVNNDRVIQLKSGRIVVPCGLHRIRCKSWFAKPGEKQEGFLSGTALVTFFFSDDGGANWFESVTNLYECFPNGGGLQEPGVVELYDGRLWSWSRASAHALGPKYACQWVSWSEDKALNWSPAQASKFLSPCSPMSVKRIPGTRDLLAIWNDHSRRFKTKKATKESWGRTPLVSAISSDNGKTWKRHKLLEDAPDHGYCYIAIHFTGDAVLLAYCAGGKSTKMVLDMLRVRRISLEELY